MEKQKQTFIQGTMILLAAGIINRLLGFIPRIALPRVIGAEGVGLYQMGFPFLMLLLTIVTGGIPLAVAKLVAEAEIAGDKLKVKRILKMSLLFTLSLSVLFALICLIAAPPITRLLFTDKRVVYTLLCMSPIIPMVAVSSVFRGYYQGKQNMIPTAISQVSETLVRIVGMLALSYSLAPYGLAFAAAGAMGGTLLGELAGMLILLFQYARNRDNPSRAYNQQTISNEKKNSSNSSKAVLRKLIRVSVPVTASKLVGSFSYFFESILTVQSLAIAGIATAVATMQYGSLQGMIIPILLLPGVLTYSLSVSLVPSLSEANAKGDTQMIHKRLHQSLKLALVSGAPFAVFMYVLADPICYYLYGNSEISVMLRMMAPTALFIYCQGPLQASLQALNRPGVALVNTMIGSIIKLTLIFLLASKPNFGILGAIMALNINVMLVTLLHWNSVSRMLRFTMPSKDFLKVAVLTVGTGLICHFMMDNAAIISSPFLRFLASLSVGTLFYLLGILLLQLVDRDDLKKLPYIGKRFF